MKIRAVNPHEINQAHWQKLKRRVIPRKQVLSSIKQYQIVDT